MTTWYEAKGILDEKRVSGKLFYLIDWADDPKTAERYKPTWEAEGDANFELVFNWNRKKAPADVSTAVISRSSKRRRPSLDHPEELLSTKRSRKQRVELSERLEILLTPHGLYNSAEYKTYSDSDLDEAQLSEQRSGTTHEPDSERSETQQKAHSTRVSQRTIPDSQDTFGTIISLVGTGHVNPESQIEPIFESSQGPTRLPEELGFLHSPTSSAVQPEGDPGSEKPQAVGIEAAPATVPAYESRSIPNVTSGSAADIPSRQLDCFPDHHGSHSLSLQATEDTEDERTSRDPGEGKSPPRFLTQTQTLDFSLSESQESSIDQPHNRSNNGSFPLSHLSQPPTHPPTLLEGVGAEAASIGASDTRNTSDRTLSGLLHSAQIVQGAAVSNSTTGTFTQTQEEEVFFASEDASNNFGAEFGNNALIHEKSPHRLRSVPDSFEELQEGGYGGEALNSEPLSFSSLSHHPVLQLRPESLVQSLERADLSDVSCDSSVAASHGSRLSPRTRTTSPRRYATASSADMETLASRETPLDGVEQEKQLRTVPFSQAQVDPPLLSPMVVAGAPAMTVVPGVNPFRASDPFLPESAAAPGATTTEGTTAETTVTGDTQGTDGTADIMQPFHTAATSGYVGHTVNPSHSSSLPSGPPTESLHDVLSMASLPELETQNSVPTTIAPSALLTSTNSVILPANPSALPILDHHSEPDVLPGVASLVSSPGPAEDADHEPQSFLSRFGSNEYVVTLPLAANTRDRYLRLLIKNRVAIGEFNRPFTSLEFFVPEDSVVRKIDNLFSQLLDLCDLPAFNADLGGMSSRDMARHATGTNSKMLFVYELLEKLRDVDVQVLILVRPGPALDNLAAILETEGFKFRLVEEDSQACTDDGSLQCLRVVLASTEQSGVLLPSDVGVVISYDESSRSTGILEPFIVRNDNLDHSHMPTVLNLVATYSLEQIDLHIPRSWDALERKNALLISTCQARELLADFPPFSSPEPHEVALNFAELIRDPTYEWAWRPQLIPDEVFDVYLRSQSNRPVAASSQQPNNNLAVGAKSRSPSRKRQLDDTEEDDQSSFKRAKPNHPLSLEESRKVINFSETLDSQLAKLPKPSSPYVEVPLAHMEKMAEKIAALEQQLEEKDAVEKLHRDKLANFEKHIRDYNKIINRFQPKYIEAIKERGFFEAERDTAVSAQRKLQQELDASKAQVGTLKSEAALLEQKLANATAALADSDHPEVAALGQAKQGLADAEARSASLQRRLDAQAADLGYARAAYQEASSRAADLGAENRLLAEQGEELSRRARADRAAVARAHAQSEAQDLQRQLAEALAVLHDRDREVERLRDEVRLLRNGRRETRGQSVPRSPRMGPRAVGGGVVIGGFGQDRIVSGGGFLPSSSAAGGAGSRGGSPAPGVGGYDGNGGGVPFFAQQQGSSRFDHLRH